MNFILYYTLTNFIISHTGECLSVLTADVLQQAAPWRRQGCGPSGNQTQESVLAAWKAGVLTVKLWNHQPWANMTNTCL